MKPRRPGNPVSVAERNAVPLQLIDLGLTRYRDVHRLQLRLVENRYRDPAAGDTMLVTEHRPVFTLGRRGGRDNLLVSESFLKAQGVDLVQIERGGLITYHGPGQLVVYPIISLRQWRLSVGDYVWRLEEVMIELARRIGVVARRDGRNNGVWVNDRKLGSVGIAVRHGVTFHGLALNVDPDLRPFSWVNPCGLSQVEMTSLAGELGETVAVSCLTVLLDSVMAAVFGCDCTWERNTSYGWPDDTSSS